MVDAGGENSTGQRLFAKTDKRGNHRYAKLWILECTVCGHRYGVNSCDFHIRKCPEPHGGGKPGLPIPNG